VNWADALNTGVMRGCFRLTSTWRQYYWCADLLRSAAGWGVFGPAPAVVFVEMMGGRVDLGRSQARGLRDAGKACA